MTTLKSFFACDDGATTIEYALIAGLIAVAIVGSVAAFHERLGVLYTEIADAMPE